MDFEDYTQAKIGYEAYGAHTGWLTFDGRTMPTWDQLPEKTRLAWAAAAQAIVIDTKIKIGRAIGAGAPDSVRVAG